MFPAAFEPWWPNIPPPSASVRSVMEPASEVRMTILAEGGREEAMTLGGGRGHARAIGHNQVVWHLVDVSKFRFVGGEVVR